MSTYKIVRFYQKRRFNDTIRTGLTLKQAKAHCSDPETSSKTATTPEATQTTLKHGPWFDGYEEEKSEV